MPNITKRGRELLTDMWRAGFESEWEQHDTYREILSLIARHAKTARRLTEIQCGDGIHSGEWVNAHAEWLEKRETQVERRLLALADMLPDNVAMEMNGDPRGWVVRLIVTDETGVPRTVGVD